MDSVKKMQLVAGIVFVFLLLLSMIVAAAFHGWLSWKILSNPLVIAGFISLVFTAIVLYAAYSLIRDDSPGTFFGRKSAQQLDSTEAYQLLDYYLFFEECIRIGETVQKGTDNVNPLNAEHDTVRLYKLVFERVNVDERVGVLLDLEQPINVDVEDPESLKDAAKRIENIRVVRGSKVDDFEESLEQARKEIGKSQYQVLTETQYDEEGNPVREFEKVPPEVYGGHRPEGSGED